MLLKFSGYFAHSELPLPNVTIIPYRAPIIGEDFSVECDAVFDQTVATVTFQWLINGSSLYRDGVNISLSNETSTLTVTNVSFSDEGIYTCVVTLDIADVEVPNDTVVSKPYEFKALGKSTSWLQFSY